MLCDIKIKIKIDNTLPCWFFFIKELGNINIDLRLLIHPK